jgi:precorrin-6B methylase 2
MATDQDKALDDRLRAMVHGYRRTQVVSAMVRLGLVEALEAGPRPAAELADDLGCEPAAFALLLRTLAAEKLLERTGPDEYRLSQLGERLQDGADGWLRQAAELAGAEFYQAWGAGLDAVRTGGSGFRSAFGRGFWEYVADHQRVSATFGATMSASIAVAIEQLAADPVFQDCRTLMDLGGGTGALAAALLRRRPGLRAVVVDLPALEHQARAALAAAGVASRCEFRSGSFIEQVPGGADRYVLSRVLCDWTDEDAVRILRNCREAMGPGALLVLVARLTDDSRLAQNPMLDLHMHILLGSHDRTGAEYARLFSLADLEQRETRPLANTDLTLITASAG